MKRRQKEPRAHHGKVRKHHWFKSGWVNMRLAKEQLTAEQERKKAQESHSPTMYESIRQLFNREKA